MFEWPDLCADQAAPAAMVERAISGQGLPGAVRVDSVSSPLGVGGGGTRTVRKLELDAKSRRFGKSNFTPFPRRTRLHSDSAELAVVPGSSARQSITPYSDWNDRGSSANSEAASPAPPSTRRNYGDGGLPATPRSDVDKYREPQNCPSWDVGAGAGIPPPSPVALAAPAPSRRSGAGVGGSEMQPCASVASWAQSRWNDADTTNLAGAAGGKDGEVGAETPVEVYDSGGSGVASLAADRGAVRAGFHDHV